jgi:excinuclease UvrABC nuclease subunit
MGYYIYKHTNKENQVVYVGQKINMESRQCAHKNSSEWKDSINKIEFSEVTDSLLMDIYEKYYISKYNPINNKEYIDCQYSRFFTNLEELKFILRILISLKGLDSEDVLVIGEMIRQA